MLGAAFVALATETLALIDGRLTALDEDAPLADDDDEATAPDAVADALALPLEVDSEFPITTQKSQQSKFQLSLMASK